MDREWREMAGYLRGKYGVKMSRLRVDYFDGFELSKELHGFVVRRRIAFEVFRDLLYEQFEQSAVEMCEELAQYG